MVLAKYSARQCSQIGSRTQESPTKVGTQNIIWRPNETGNRPMPGAIDSAFGHCPPTPPLVAERP